MSKDAFRTIALFLVFCLVSENGLTAGIGNWPRGISFSSDSTIWLQQALSPSPVASYEGERHVLENVPLSVRIRRQASLKRQEMVSVLLILLGSLVFADIGSSKWISMLAGSDIFWGIFAIGETSVGFWAIFHADSLWHQLKFYQPFQSLKKINYWHAEMRRHEDDYLETGGSTSDLDWVHQVFSFRADTETNIFHGRKFSSAEMLALRSGIFEGTEDPINFLDRMVGRSTAYTIRSYLDARSKWEALASVQNARSQFGKPLVGKVALALAGAVVGSWALIVPMGYPLWVSALTIGLTWISLFFITAELHELRQGRINRIQGTGNIALLSTILFILWWSLIGGSVHSILSGVTSSLGVLSPRMTLSRIATGLHHPFVHTVRSKALDYEFAQAA